MSKLDSFFEKHPEIKHPKVPSWEALLKEGNGTCEVVRKRAGLGFQPAKLYLRVESANAGPKTDQDDWDIDLNQFLLAKRIRAVDPENEKLRFSLMLKELLKKPENRFGDGYFNAVLMELVASAFEDSSLIKGQLLAIPTHKPNKGVSYRECVSMIEESIARCARYLMNELSYDRPQAELILAGAMGHYLDERFSVTSRKLLGLR